MKKLLALYALVVGIVLLAALGLVLGGRRAAARPTVLSWRLTGALPDHAKSSWPLLAPEEPSFGEIEGLLRAARTDHAVAGLAVTIDQPEFGLAKAEEVRDELLALRQAGKFVSCQLATAGEAGNGTLPYFLATGCDDIVLGPLGDVNLLGLSAESLYLRGTLDKLKIDAEFIKIGPFKSAPEMFTETGPTPAASTALGAVLDGFYSQIVEAVATSRKLQPARVRQLIDAAPFTAQEAVANHLVDALAYPDQFRQRIISRAGGHARILPLTDYDDDASRFGDGVAVVAVSGALVRGDDLEGSSVDADAIAQVLAHIERDDAIRALVLRVDSPGGSVLAADLILHAVERVHQKKPVIVSMADAAASGGYYIAAHADRIVAEPATLTGSIGVFTGKFVTRRFEEEILGIHRQAERRGADAGLYSSLTPFSAAQQAAVKKSIETVYRTFVGHVAAGRHLSRQAVDAIGQGRVWSGADGRRIGLVDEIGGLDRALVLARQAAHLPDDAPVHLYPEASSWLDRFRRRSANPLPESLARLAAVFDQHPVRWLELAPEWSSLLHPFATSGSWQRDSGR